MNDLKSLLTIVVCIHERKHTLPASQEHYNNCPYNVVYSDSSETKSDVTETDNIKYIHDANMLYYSKMIKILDTISTPYVIEICDDMILNFDAIKECLSFLENNKDYCFAQGTDVRATRKKLNQNGLAMNLDGLSLPDMLRQYVKGNVWQAPNHSVVRKEILEKIYKFVEQEPSIYPIRWFDKIWGFIALTHGKFKRLDMPHNTYIAASRIIESMANYPEILQRHRKFDELRNDEDNLTKLSKILVNAGYDEGKSIDITKEIFSKYYTR
tara:strand:+ start:1640 stop:2446 length:807 start_codon:yes stop_codon:yes gene_type:complete